MPLPGKPEAVISEGLARNKKVKIGDVIASPLDTGTLVAAPAKITLVGILKGPTWMAFTSKRFTDENLAAVPRSLLVTTKDPADQGRVGDTLFDSLDKFQVQVLSFNNLVKTLRNSLASMYLIMHLVNGTVIFVVALMAGMLSNIYFTQRISEFAVLAAIGLRRSTLIWHAVSETAILTTLGWLIGVAINFVRPQRHEGQRLRAARDADQPRRPALVLQHAADPGLHHAVRRRHHQLPAGEAGPRDNHRKTLRVTDSPSCQPTRFPWFTTTARGAPMPCAMSASKFRTGGSWASWGLRGRASRPCFTS